MRYLALIFLFLPYSAFAAIGYVSSGGVTSMGTTQNPSTTIDIGTGSDLILIATLFNGTDSVDTSASATWNGSAMTKDCVVATSGGGAAVSGFYINNASSGSHTIAFTTNASKDYRLMWVSYSGAVFDDGACGADSGTKTTSTDINITSTQSGDWGVFLNFTGAAPAAGTNVNSSRLSGAYFRAGDSNASLGVANTYTMGMTQANEWWYGGFAAAIKDAPVAAPALTAILGGLVRAFFLW